jgi:16S rRNA (guanine527-N7)-methyltransferase
LVRWGLSPKRPIPAETLTPTSPHAPALVALGLVEPATSRLCRYLDTLAAWSPRINLTGARTPAERVRLLVESVLPALTCVSPGTLIDVGSGNGSPGLVLALLREEIEATLLEPRQRRWAFLREAVRATGVSAVEVVRARHDTYQGPAAQTVTMRALSLPLGELGRLLKPTGRLIVFGAVPEPGSSFALEPVREPRPGIHCLRRVGVPRET